MQAPSGVVSGRRFYHRRFIDSDLNPSLYQVTRIAQGVVYYAQIDPNQDSLISPKASLKSPLDYFLYEALGAWQNASPTPDAVARSLRRWAANNAIRQVSPLSERAHLVAAYLHAEDRDKAGAPYLNHIQAVADGVEGDDAKVVAYLHDSKEDHGVSDLDFEWLGFTPEHIDGINGVTKLPSEHGEAGYHEFVARAARHPLSRAVKLADLRDNARLDRIPVNVRTDRDLRRVAKYQREIAWLESQTPPESTLADLGEPPERLSL